MSTTTNIGLFKHDNPSTNTDEFNVDKALNQNWDKLDTAIGKDRERITTLETDNTTNKTDISNIKSKDTEQDKYISELEAENIRLKEDLNGLPKGQVSGERIDLTDSAEMRCELKISGNSKQETRSGKNYLNMFTKYKAGDTTTINNVKITFNKDGSITCNGTASADITFDFSATSDGQIINGTDKKLLALINGEYSYTKAITYIVYDKNWGNTKYVNLTSANKSVTQAMADNVEYSIFRIIIYKDTIIQNRTLYLQVLDTLQEDLSYEPYGASPSTEYPSEVQAVGDNGSINEVICSEDLLKETSWKKNYILNSNNEEEKIDGWYLSDYIDISEGDYIYTSKNSGVKPKNILYDKNKNVIGLFNVEARETSLTQYNAKYIRLSVSEIGKEKNTLCKKQTYTIPTQQPFRAIGDIRDTFIKKNDKWYERHYIPRKIFDGTEEIGILWNTGKYGYNIKISDMKMTSSTSDKSMILSNMYKVYTQDDLFNLKYPANGIACRANKNEIIIRDDNITTLSDLITNLSTNKPYVDYILETPLDIECTEEQNTILDKIEKEAKTYKNVTHIYSTDEISPVIDVTYKKDIDTMISNIEQAILSQGGNI